MPQKQYDNFYVDIDNGAIRLPDMNTNMIINSLSGCVDVVDKNIISPITLTSANGYLSVKAEIFSSPLTIKNNSGYTNIVADEIKDNITIEGKDKANTTGFINFVLNKYPQNMSLELNTKSGVANLPKNWNKNMTIGNGKPSVKIFNNSGYTNFIVK